MGSPRHSPCLGYLLAILFILSISLQCVNSLHGAFKVETKFVKKPFPTLRSRHGPIHDRKLFSSPIDLPVAGGNSTHPLYIMEIGVGTPPQIHKVLVDTGSAPIWLNCKACVNCKTENTALGIEIPSYDPTLSTTSKAYSFKEEHCRQEAPGDRCGFNYGYGAGDRAVEGYLMEDTFVIGNPLTGQSISANLRFGCAMYQVYTADSDGNDFLKLGIDGIMGFGDYGHSLITQLNSSGVATPELSHCLDNINGGGIFAIGNILEPQVVMNDRYTTDYTLELMGMDFGGEDIKLNGTPLGVFDIGSDRLYAPVPVYNDISSKFDSLLATKNAITKARVNASTCFKLPAMDLSYEVVDKEFPILSLHFAQSQVLNVSPRNYIRPNEDEGFEGYWCLHVSSITLSQDGRDIFFIGSPIMSEKLMVYDNVNNKLGFVDHDCSVPIQIEGADGKPMPVGPYLGNAFESVDKMT